MIADVFPCSVTQELPEQGRIYCFPLKKSEEEELLEAKMASKQNAVSLEQVQNMYSTLDRMTSIDMHCIIP